MRTPTPAMSSCRHPPDEVLTTFLGKAPMEDEVVKKDGEPTSLTIPHPVTEPEYIAIAPRTHARCLTSCIPSVHHCGPIRQLCLLKRDAAAPGDPEGRGHDCPSVQSGQLAAGRLEDGSAEARTGPSKGAKEHTFRHASTITALWEEDPFRSPS